MNKKENIKINIQKSGFILEYDVSEILIANGWQVICNKYYLDDITGIPREIDIVAYKAKYIFGIRYYTCLLISCKKSEERDWVFLTKRKNEKVLNRTTRFPFRSWTNSPVFELASTENNFEDLLYNEINKKSSWQRNYANEKEVFASQEVLKKNQKNQDDKNIFMSISSLIKAVSYELRRLPVRRKEDSIYNFFLVGVCDTEFYECYLGEDEPKVDNINSILYENQFIVDRVEDSFSILFSTYKNFTDRIHDFDDIHVSLLEYHNNLLGEFYSKLLFDERKIWFLLNKFEVNIENVIKRYLKPNELQYLDIFSIYFEYHESSKTLYLTSEFFVKDISDRLNNNSKLLEQVRVFLRKWLKYEGKVKFDLHVDEEYDDYE